MNSNKTYYEHIDGLRALAVISVILSHLDLPMFSGGFVGVDVFFVISGFLITQIIIKEIDATGDFSFLNFYTRRVRRILPALIFTLIVTLLFSIWLLNFTEFQFFGGALKAASLSISNIYFKLRSGYFDIYSKTNPLLHTWSLSVEEQFYLILPVLILFTFRIWGKYFFRLILVIFIISFFGNIKYQSIKIQSLYYLVIYRAFEFCIGAFCIWFINYKFRKNITLEILCLIGIMLIVYPIINYDSTTIFPSYNALPPTIGAALIICSGQAKYLGIIFRNKMSRFIGAISYSLYLIHWPIIVFWKAYDVKIRSSYGGLPDRKKIIIFIISLLLATIMYYCIEQPFRKKIPKSRKEQKFIIIRWVSALIILALIGSSISSSRWWQWRLENPSVSYKLKDIKDYHVKNWGGVKFSGGYIYSPDEPDIVMMGDSFSGMLNEGIVEEIAKPYKLTVFTASGGGAGKYVTALLLPGITSLNPAQDFYDKSAREAHLEALNELFKSKDSIFIFSANFSTQLGLSGHLDSHKSLGINPDTMTEYHQYKPFIDALDNFRKMLKGHRFLIIGDFPGSSKYSSAECLVQLKWLKNKNNCLAKQPINTVKLGARNVNKILKEYASKHSEVYFIDPYDFLCEDGFCVNINDEGLPLYSDNLHLSKEGSKYFISKVKNIIVDIILNK